MSDISKIHINPTGGDHNIKDATARNAIQSSKTIKSSVVTVNDAAPINAEDITVDITPVQLGSGTPSPDNIRPIEGRTGAELDRVGKNKLTHPFTQSYPLTFGGVTIADDNGRLTLNGTCNIGFNTILVGNSNAVWGSLDNAKSLPMPDGDYTISGGDETVKIWINQYRNGEILNTYGVGAQPIVISVLSTDLFEISAGLDKYKTYSNLTISPQIELGTQPTAYEPYQGQQYTANFGETVYGGKWHVTDGGTDKSKVSASGWVQYASGNGYKAYKIENLPARNKDISDISDLMSNLVGEYGTFSSGAMTKNVIQPPFSSNPTKAYMALREDIDPSTVQFLYDKDTPTTISTPKQNVPMLQGINTVSADCGDTQLKYQPDNVIGELKGEIEDSIIYEDFKWTTNSSQSYSAGTPGTYGTSSSRNVAKEGYDVIGVTFVENRRFGDCILTLYYIPSTSHVEVIIFRATSSAVTIADEDIEYRVAYKKRT